jgi:putative ABC transport system permease protein
MNYYLRMYIRSLRREKTRLLNILSIAITLTFALLILFFIEDELSYDKWNVNRKNVYRVETFEKWPAKTFNKATTTSRIGPNLLNEFPEIESFVRFVKIRTPKVGFENKEFIEDKFFYADSSVFSIFPYELKAGSSKTALSSPNSIVLSEELTQKYFNESNPLGKTLLLNGQNYTLTGIMDNSPKAHLVCNALISISDSTSKSNNTLSYTGEAYTYVLTQKNTDIEKLSAKLPGFYDKYITLEEGYDYKLMFEPLSEVHFSAKKLENDLPTMNITYIYIFEVQLVIILIFSCLNYINLVVGNSVKTGKFIGINKIYGIKKGQIFTHFISDSLINVSLAIGISLLLLLLIIPQYNVYFDKNLNTNIFSNHLVLTNILFLFILIGIVPGIILASIFTSIKPLFILKNQYVKRSASIRRVFIFMEISMLIIVVFGILVVNFQLYNLKKNNLGFDSENVLFIKIKDQNLIRSAEVLKDAFKEHPEVLEVAASDAGIGDDYWIASYNVEVEKEMKYFELKRLVVDENFAELYDLELIKGRTFDRSKGTDIQNCIINEAAALQLGLGNTIINKRILLPGKDEGVIIGVVKDFYFHSKHNEIEPLFICLAKKGGYTPLISVKIAAGQLTNSIQTLATEWEDFSPNTAFNYTSAEEKIKSFYKNEERLNTVFKWGTVLSFSIVCFGMICFVIFIVEQKSKEISIRKVNGASIFHIVKSVLLNEYLGPVIISFVTVLPISFFIIRRGMQSMVTEVSISWWVFVLTIIIILITLFATTFFQLYRATNKNPIEALRNQ